jgi:heterodisulfide reductase subunit A-like polyferredoxin
MTPIGVEREPTMCCRCPLRLNPDLLVLATAVLPNENKDLFELFKVPINAEGFLVEAHAKLRPVDFGSEGIFMAGLAHYPKPMDETIAQARQPSPAP